MAPIAATGDDHPELAERTGVKLKGKSAPVKLYAPST